MGDQSGDRGDRPSTMAAFGHWDDPLLPLVVVGLLEANASDVTTLSSADGVLRFVSASVIQTLGWSPEELTGRQVDDLIHPDDRDGARHGREAALRTSQTVITTQRGSGPRRRLPVDRERDQADCRPGRGAR